MGYLPEKKTVSQFDLKGRFARQYLSFAGKSSKDFLLYLSGPGVYDSPAADVESTSVPGRNGDIISENARAGWIWCSIASLSGGVWKDRGRYGWKAGATS